MHFEIQALQSRYGISYKDAAHCLYLSEIRQLMADNAAYKAMTEFYDRTNTSTINAIEKRINEIDLGALDDENINNSILSIL